MVRQKSLRCALLALAALGTIVYAQRPAQVETPETIVRGTAEAILRAMDGRREYLEANPAELDAVVRSVFLPRFDTAYASFLVLGRHGRNASAEQKARFTTALYNYILNRYGRGLLQFDSDRLEILPMRGEPDADRATIRTLIALDDGSKIPVNYDLRLGSGGWKVYDIVIEGISFARNLRSQIGAEIEANGLDSVILRLEADRERDAGDAGA
ncbi:MlaC/ttg2D family ABC transporter substrate-binding protein [Candidatus Rariloculus sp.]|uniref:MlaC/ttg2D family ABC transporter substrate-binding protein n=1 Tax=Candidatus Rariloculus sp. TaxID=3101265 RepID=UPI003D0BC5E4